MKIAVRFGHQLTGADGGAVGIVKETDVNRRYGPKVISKLQALGHTVINVTPPEAHRSLSDSLNYGINLANSNNVDLFVSCHVNAFMQVDKAMGCEVVCSGSGKGLDYAKKIVDELAALGFKNRGGKSDERGLAEIRKTAMPCVIIEPFFMDSSVDVNVYKKVGDEGIANAIVKGITGKTSNNTAPVVNVVNNVVASAPIQPSPATNTGDLNSFAFLQHEFNSQFRARIAEDNIPGPITISKCPLVKQGARGNITKWIQNRLNKLGFNCGVADGIFGNMTANAVRAFQKRYGLVADGIIGINTWRKLLGL